jgi:hypothetical protein
LWVLHPLTPGNLAARFALGIAVAAKVGAAADVATRTPAAGGPVGVVACVSLGEIARDSIGVAAADTASDGAALAALGSAREATSALRLAARVSASTAARASRLAVPSLIAVGHRAREAPSSPGRRTPRRWPEPRPRRRYYQILGAWLACRDDRAALGEDDDFGITVQLTPDR